MSRASVGLEGYRVVPTPKQRGVGLLLALLLLGASVGFLMKAGNRLETGHLSISPVVLTSALGSLLIIQVVSAWLWVGFSRAARLRRSGSETLIDMGLLAVGKYVPGKLIGLLGRGSVKGDRFDPDRRDMTLSVSEQLICLWAGLLLAGTFLVAVQHGESPLVTLALAPLAVLLTTLPIVTLDRISHSRAVNSWFHPFRPGFCGSFLLGGGYLALWAMNTVPTMLLAQLVPGVGGSLFVEIGVAMLIATIAGWLTVVVPAGLVVREATFVAFAPEALGTDQAIWLAAVHRSVTVGFDILLGLTTMALIAWRVKHRVGP